MENQFMCSYGLDMRVRLEGLSVRICKQTIGNFSSKLSGSLQMVWLFGGGGVIQGQSSGMMTPPGGK
jgi:hypothetical protein